jgi:hypothetical protein
MHGRRYSKGCRWQLSYRFPCCGGGGYGRLLQRRCCSRKRKPQMQHCAPQSRQIVTEIQFYSSIMTFRNIIFEF